MVLIPLQVAANERHPYLRLLLQKIQWYYQKIGFNFLHSIGLEIPDHLSTWLD